MTPPRNSNAVRDIANVLHPYTDHRAHAQNGPLVITRGEGVRVWDDQGKEYIEALAGLWCASLGFDNKRLVDAAYRIQAGHADVVARGSSTSRCP